MKMLPVVGQNYGEYLNKITYCTLTKLSIRQFLDKSLTVLRQNYLEGLDKLLTKLLRRLGQIA